MGEVRLEADAVVIGGGAAGCMCAIHLLEEHPELRVVVLEKSSLRRGGNACTGIDHYMAISPRFFGGSRTRFMREVVARNVLPAIFGGGETAILGMVGPEVMEESFRGILKLEEMGVRVRDPGGGFRLVDAAGGKAIWIEGADVKPIFSRRVKGLGARVLERVCATEVLLDDGRVGGAVGFDSRTGEFVRVDAPAVVISTGGVNRLWEPVLRDSSAAPFDTAYCPYDNGEGHTAALRAGAHIYNTEFLAATITPVDWATPGISGFLSAGCDLLNARGERFMERYEPRSPESPQRQKITWGMYREAAEGRVPIYVGTSSLSPDEVRDMRNAWSNEVPLMHRYVEAKGIEVGKDSMEAEIHLAAAIPKIINRGDMMTRVPGLFAAGDASSEVGLAFTGAMLGGPRVSRGVSEYLREGGARTDPERLDGQAAESRERVFSYLEREGDLGWWDVERELKRTMTRYFGIARNGAGMKAGGEKLAEIGGMLDRVGASNPHELMRLHETLSLLEIAGIVAETALERTESRVIGQAGTHYRSDYPKPDHRGWNAILAVSKEDGRVRVEKRKVPGGRAAFLAKGMRMLFLGPRFNKA